LLLALLLSGLVFVVFSANTAVLVKLTNAPKDFGAMCLDGSPPAYYFQKGSGTGANKWEFHHEGGGYCTSLQSCYDRSQTSLGSSNSYGATGELPNDYLSNDPNVNPLMYNWNKAYFKYCDGAFFSGNNDTVAKYNGRSIYYRGFKILMALRQSLYADHGLGQATEVVVGGCSAGGIATFLHLDWWRSMLPSNAKVVGLPDSGFLPDYNAPNGGPNFATQMRTVYHQMNSSSGVNQDCIAAYAPKGDTSPCFFAQYTSQYIKAPFFPLQSVYDAWQLDNVLGTKAPAEVNKFGAYVTDLIVKSVTSNPKNGGFFDSCVHHCGGWGLKNNGQRVADVMQKWYTGGAGVVFQHQPFPCASCCS